MQTLYEKTLLRLAAGDGDIVVMTAENRADQLDR
jgi:hypothetical protein